MLHRILPVIAMVAITPAAELPPGVPGQQLAPRDPTLPSSTAVRGLLAAGSATVAAVPLPNFTVHGIVVGMHQAVALISLDGRRTRVRVGDRLMDRSQRSWRVSAIDGRQVRVQHQDRELTDGTGGAP